MGHLLWLPASAGPSGTGRIQAPGLIYRFRARTFSHPRVARSCNLICQFPTVPVAPLEGARIAQGAGVHQGAGGVAHERTASPDVIGPD
jgi:hypothetical protein